MKHTHTLSDKTIAFVLSVSLLTAGASFATYAGTSTADQVTTVSTGKIQYAPSDSSEKVNIDASDITTLANKYNALSTGLTDIQDSLDSIGKACYARGNSSFTSGQTSFGAGAINTYMKDVDSMPSGLAATQATDKDGKALYYTNDTALNAKDLTSTTNDTSKVTMAEGKTIDNYKVFYQPATAANLTAGTAAWGPNGLIKGNGSDNTAFNTLGSTKKILSIGSGDTSGARTFNVTNIPNYKSFTTDDFMLNCTGTGYCQSDGTTTSGLSKSYNSATGILSVGASYAIFFDKYWGSNMMAYSNYSVYVLMH